MDFNEVCKKVDDGIILRLKIAPNSAKNQLILSDDIIKLKITAQPIENKANKAVIEYLSKLFKIPKTSISILKGDTSKEKTLLFKTDNEEKIEKIKTILLGGGNS
jgi:hypothetical protein